MSGLGTKAALVSIPSNRGKPSDRKRALGAFGAVWVSIPSNRGKPSDVARHPGTLGTALVSIPSNRGKPSDGDMPRIFFCTEWSQSPQIGASLRTDANIAGCISGRQVSIPSNRGKPSDFTFCARNYTWRNCLNPLKSGQAFGPKAADSFA